MTRQVQAVLLIVIGLIVFRLTVFGDYLNYVKPSLQPFLIASAALVFLLGVVSFVHNRLAGAHGEQEDVERPLPVELTRPRSTDGPTFPVPYATDHHQHRHHGPGVGWLFCVPMFVVLLIPPPALGSYAANRYGATVPEPASTILAPLPAGAVLPLPVKDYAVRATWGAGTTLKGRTIRLTGFVTPQADGGWYLTRLSLICCAADGRAAKVEVQGMPNEYPASAWVRVTGTWVPSPTPEPAVAIPQVRATSVEKITEPDNPYE